MRRIDANECKAVNAAFGVAGCAAGAANGAGTGAAAGGVAGGSVGGVAGAAVGGVAGGVAGAAAGCAVGAAGAPGAGAGAGAAVGGAAGAAAAAAANGGAANVGVDAMGNVTGPAASAEGISAVSSNDSGGGGGGGKVICTELCRNGAIEHEVWMADIRYSRQNFSEQTMRGYHLWGIPYVKLMRKYPTFAKLAEYPTLWFAEDIAYRMGVLSKPNYKGWVLREVFFRPVCFGIGLFAKARDWQALWRDGVTPAGVRS